MDPHLEKLFKKFQDVFNVGRGAHLLEVKGINTVFIQDLFKELAEVWRSCPWKWLSSKDLLGFKVGSKSDWKPLARQPFNYLRVSSANGKGVAIDVFRSEKDVVGSDGKPNTVITENGLLRITFGSEGDLLPRVRKMIRFLGLEIADTNAYPAVEVIYQSKVKDTDLGNSSKYRNPCMAELRWLIDTLRAFVRVHPKLQTTIQSGRCSNIVLHEEVEVSLPDITGGCDYPSENKSTLSVRVTYNPKVSVENIPMLREGNDHELCCRLGSRECIYCLKVLPPERAPRCGGCKAVFYCDSRCQKRDWREIHKDQCDEYKGMMDRSQRSKTNEFLFPMMNYEQPCEWLASLGLHDRGMWRRVCDCNQHCPPGYLPTAAVVDLAHETAWSLKRGKYPSEAPLVIPIRNARSEESSYSKQMGADYCKPIGNPPTSGVQCSLSLSDGTGIPVVSSMEEPEGTILPLSSTGSKGLILIKGQQSVNTSEAPAQISDNPRCGGGNGYSILTWQDYYSIRSLSFSSPAAVILTYPLTIYHIVNNICVSTKRMLAMNKEVTVHYIGPREELDWMPAFSEIGHLLTAFHVGRLHIVMIGPEVGIIHIVTIRPNIHRTFSGETIALGKRLKITFVQGTYTEESPSLSTPHLVVALNAGIDRLESWANDLATIKKHAVPAYFTEYAETSYINARRVLHAAELPLTMPATINPFRSPVNCLVPFTEVPWYANGVLYGVNT